MKFQIIHFLALKFITIYELYHVTILSTFAVKRQNKNKRKYTIQHFGWTMRFMRNKTESKVKQ